MHSVQSKARKLVVSGLAFAIAIVCVVWVWRVSQRLKVAEADLQRAMEVDAPGKKAEVPSAKTANVDRKLPAVVSDDSSVSADIAALRAPPTIQERELLADLARQTMPEFYEQYIESQRAGVGRQYAPFYAALELSDSQIAAFEELMVAHDERIMDLNASSWQGSGTEFDTAILAMIDEEEGRLRAAQLELLGGANFQNLVEFERNRPMREFVDDIGSRLSVTSSPIDHGQADDLTQIIKRNRTATSASQEQRLVSLTVRSNPLMAGPLDTRGVDWEAVIHDATEVLSGPQLDLFIQIAEHYNESAMTKQMLQAIREGYDPELLLR